MSSRCWRIEGEEAMLELGRQLASALPPRALLLLSGDLGAGKTTLAKGIAEGIGAARAEDVSSPTFTLVHEYGDPVSLYHIDLYRLEDQRQLATLGLDEILDRTAVTVIEWPDKFLQWLPKEHYRLTLVHAGDARHVTLTSPPDVPDLPAILSTASVPMEEHLTCGECKDTFALVAYLPGPLAEFLNGLRSRLDPGSEPNAHITLLPPRLLSGTPEEARLQIREFAAQAPPFSLELASIEIFQSTNVVFLGLSHGRRTLFDIHNSLNVGALRFPEPHAFHPHITLVQFQPAEAVSSVAEQSRTSWAGYPGDRHFTVSRLTFVQHIGGNTWLDLESFDLLG